MCLPLHWAKILPEFNEWLTYSSPNVTEVEFKFSQQYPLGVQILTKNIQMLGFLHCALRWSSRFFISYFQFCFKAENHLALSGFVKGYSIYPTVSNFQDELRSGQRFQFFLYIIYKDNSGRNTHLKLKWPNVGYFLLFFFFFLWRRQQKISH